MTRVPTARARLTVNRDRAITPAAPLAGAFHDWVSHQPRLIVLLVAAALAWVGVGLIGALLIAIIT